MTILTLSPAETLALKLTRSNRTIAVAYATEAGRFQGAGIPTVVCGPGDIAQAHQPDEYIELSQIDAGLAFMRALAAELAGSIAAIGRFPLGSRQ